MNLGSTIFSQLVGFLAHNECQKCVSRYCREHKRRIHAGINPAHGFSELTHREGLCDIERCLRVAKDKLYHI